MGLYRYNLGVDPKEEAEEKNLVSPFMKLEMDEPKKVHVELDLDEGNLSRGMVIIKTGYHKNRQKYIHDF